ncbi:LemA family protein [Shewanella surugensis]|uniref:LemA family protein n=1 Tax=Shewanella surugensis TaxID=212020 RepID=A0ABT0LCS7_9GAMM|nr:LemA family protein [Shewanella surugensis]MCL1125507.1 LemA family protein [Shewanella surugensis]
MKGLVLVIGLVFVISYLWAMSLFKKRDAAQEALHIMDGFLAKQITLVTQLLASQLKDDTEQGARVTAIDKISIQLAGDYDTLNHSAIEQHFYGMLMLNQTMLPFLTELETNNQLVQEAGLLETVQSYQDLGHSIKDAYQFYNVSVSELNTAVHVFPGSLIASLMRVESMPLYPIKRVLTK